VVGALLATVGVLVGIAVGCVEGNIEGITDGDVDSTGVGLVVGTCEG